MGHVNQVGHLSKTSLILLEIHEIGSVDTFESKQQNYDQIWHLLHPYQKLLGLSHFSWLGYSHVGHFTSKWVLPFAPGDYCTCITDSERVLPFARSDYCTSIWTFIMCLVLVIGAGSPQNNYNSIADSGNRCHAQKGSCILHYILLPNNNLPLQHLVSVAARSGSIPSHLIIIWLLEIHLYLKLTPHCG